MLQRRSHGRRDLVGGSMTGPAHRLLDDRTQDSDSAAQIGHESFDLTRRPARVRSNQRRCPPPGRIRWIAQSVGGSTGRDSWPPFHAPDRSRNIDVAGLNGGFGAALLEPVHKFPQQRILQRGDDEIGPRDRILQGCRSVSDAPRRSGQWGLRL
jgi:hypothetical protein